MTIETDYLIIGAGASGLSFADELLTRDPSAEMAIVDKRHAPGGHWNDAYSFVKLHQPSAFYGVESRELSDGLIDKSGTNAGYMSLADGPQVIDYFHRVMRERLIPSGRVRYFPLCEARDDGAVRNLLSGATEPVKVRKKIVDAAYLANSVPLTHVRKFSVADGVACAPPNDLPRRAPEFSHFVVLGAGKTGIDACVWLLENGADPEAITWIIPRDPWLWNRATTQPSAEYFDEVFGGFAARQEALAEATSAVDFARRMEKAGVWLRLDETVEPAFFHGATISVGELDQLKRIRNIVRLGRANSIEPGRIVLEKGEATAPVGALYVDCTASAIAPRPAKTIFEDGRITVQMVRFPQPAFSGAFIGFLEATMTDDAAKNALAAPIPLPDTIDDYLKALLPDMMNRFHCSRNAEIRAWINESRLDGYSKMGRDADPDDAAKMALLARIKAASPLAVQNVSRLAAEAG